MKKILLIFILICSIHINLFSDSNKSSIINLEGTVNILRSGKTMSAEIGQIIEQGDQIITESNSICDLKFYDKTYARIGANSNLNISGNMLFEKNTIFGKRKIKKIKLNLKKGNLLSKLQKLNSKSSFKVYTPTSVVGVRGTIFNTSVNNAGTQISVYQGTVSVQNLITGVETLVSGGENISVLKNQSSDKKSSIGSKEIQQIESVVGKTETANIFVQPNITEQILTNPSTPINNNSSQGSDVIIHFNR